MSSESTDEHQVADIYLHHLLICYENTCEFRRRSYSLPQAHLGIENISSHQLYNIWNVAIYFGNQLALRRNCDASASAPVAAPSEHRWTSTFQRGDSTGRKVRAMIQGGLHPCTGVHTCAAPGVPIIREWPSVLEVGTMEKYQGNSLDCFSRLLFVCMTPPSFDHLYSLCFGRQHSRGSFTILLRIGCPSWVRDTRLLLWKGLIALAVQRNLTTAITQRKADERTGVTYRWKSEKPLERLRL